MAYDLNNDYKKAIELYKIVENFDFKEKKILFNNLAKCYLNNNNIDEAKNYYQKALEFNQNDKVILNNLLILYLRIGEKDKSEYFYKNDMDDPKRWVNGTLGVITFLSKDQIKVRIGDKVFSLGKTKWDKYNYQLHQIIQ